MTTEAFTGARGPGIGPSRVPLPSYEDTFADGVRVARSKLRRLPADRTIGDETRLGDYEPSSLKRLAAMNAWAEEYTGVTLQNGELEFLNGTTMGRLASYMQRKRAMLELEAGGDLTDQQLETLKAQMVAPPELPVSTDGNQALSPEAIAEHKAIVNRISDESANLLLGAMNLKLAPAF